MTETKQETQSEYEKALNAMLSFLDDWKSFPQMKEKFMGWSNVKILYCLTSLDKSGLIETDYKILEHPSETKHGRAQRIYRKRS